jgi:hypothetical protein
VSTPPVSAWGFVGIGSRNEGSSLSPRVVSLFSIVSMARNLSASKFPLDRSVIHVVVSAQPYFLALTFHEHSFSDTALLFLCLASNDDASRKIFGVWSWACWSAYFVESKRLDERARLPTDGSEGMVMPMTPT